MYEPRSNQCICLGYLYVSNGDNILVGSKFCLTALWLPPTDEIWVRMVAMFSLLLGYFYIQAARQELVPLFWWKVHGHFFGVLCMIAFVVLKLGPPALLILASADLAAGIWTGLALKYPKS